MVVEIVALVIIGWIAIGALLLCNFIYKNFEDNGDRKEASLAELMAEAADKVNKEKELEKLEDIYSSIQYAQKEGTYAIGGSGHIGKEIKKELKSQGFKVETFSEYSGCRYRESYLITWDKYRRYK